MASLEIGIIGLPNVGKTSVFNALTGNGAPTSPVGATTVSQNIGVANVPNAWLEACSEAQGSAKLIPATIQLNDVSGLVSGSGRGGGLGGEFLQHLRNADALIHVVRTFKDESVFHVDGRVDGAADAEAVDLELLFADQAVVERALERKTKLANTGNKVAGAEAEQLKALMAHLEEGHPARSFTGALPTDIDLLTRTPMVYVANCSEDGDEAAVAALESYVEGRGEVVAVSAKIEADIAEMEDAEDRAAFLSDLGIEEAAAPRVAHAAFHLIDLLQFFTVGPKEAHAWTLRRGGTAVDAAGRIHSDLARGFIRAGVIAWSDFVAVGANLDDAKKKALLRVEGKDYVVQDGDVINVLFNV